MTAFRTEQGLVDEISAYMASRRHSSPAGGQGFRYAADNRVIAFDDGSYAVVAGASWFIVERGEDLLWTFHQPPLDTATAPALVTGYTTANDAIGFLIGDPA